MKWNRNKMIKNLSRPQRGMLLCLVFVLVLNRLSNALADDKIVWRLHDVTMTLFAALSCCLAASLIPYENLRTKCIVAACAAVSISDVVLIIPFSAYWFGYSYIAQTIAAIGAIIFYWLRSYNQPSDDVQPGYVYLLRKRPVKFQDFVISMCGFFGANGGYSIYVNGMIWGFKKGVFISRKVSKLPDGMYHIKRGALADYTALVTLNEFVGARWSIFNNCITTVGGIWRKINGGVP